jgi:hypothetical protein
MPRGVPKTEAQREASRNRMRALWQDPAYRARQSAISSATMRRLREDPEFQEKRRVGHAERARSPEWRARASETFKAYYADPANREKTAAQKRELMADPATRKRYAEYCERGREARCGIFHCPPELRSRYRKLRQVLGIDAARAEIRKEIEAIVYSGVSYDDSKMAR